MWRAMVAVPQLHLLSRANCFLCPTSSIEITAFTGWSIRLILLVVACNTQIGVTACFSLYFLEFDPYIRRTYCRSKKLEHFRCKWWAKRPRDCTAVCNTGYVRRSRLCAIWSRSDERCKLMRRNNSSLLAVGTGKTSGTIVEEHTITWNYDPLIYVVS